MILSIVKRKKKKMQVGLGCFYVGSLVVEQKAIGLDADVL
jgi:hypothetical protein